MIASPKRTAVAGLVLIVVVLFWRSVIIVALAIAGFVASIYALDVWKKIARCSAVSSMLER